MRLYSRLTLCIAFLCSAAVGFAQGDDVAQSNQQQTQQGTQDDIAHSGDGGFGQQSTSNGSNAGSGSKSAASVKVTIDNDLARLPFIAARKKNADNDEERQSIENEEGLVNSRLQQNITWVTTHCSLRDARALIERVEKRLNGRIDRTNTIMHGWLKGVKAEMRNRLNKAESALRGDDGKLIRSQDLRNDIDTQTGLLEQSGAISKDKSGKFVPYNIKGKDLSLQASIGGLGIGLVALAIAVFVLFLYVRNLRQGNGRN